MSRFKSLLMFCPPRKSAGLVFVALVFLLVTSPAHAILINYEFSGTIGRGLLQLNEQASVRLDGRAFTATGMITSEVDLEASTAAGLFSATTTYDFGVAGSFTTDDDADFYYQFDIPAGTQLGLVDSSILEGLFPRFEPSLGLADPNEPQAVGEVFPDFPLAVITRTQTNLDGDSLRIDSASVNIISTSEKLPEQVPEPTTLLLLGLGLAGLGFARRRSV